MDASDERLLEEVSRDLTSTTCPQRLLEADSADTGEGGVGLSTEVEDHLRQIFQGKQLHLAMVLHLVAPVRKTSCCLTPTLQPEKPPSHCASRNLLSLPKTCSCTLLSGLVHPLWCYQRSQVKRNGLFPSLQHLYRWNSCIKRHMPSHFGLCFHRAAVNGSAEDP